MNGVLESIRSEAESNEDSDDERWERSECRRDGLEST